MALVLKEFSEFYLWCMTDLPDPRTNDFFLIDSFPKVLCLICAYLYFGIKLGPKIMENRKPFKLKAIITIYNTIQIIICGYILIIGYPLWWRYDWTCGEVPGFDEDMSIELKMGFLYYLLKFADLLDTIFFVLRKKQNQITFLHLEHHSGMIIVAWIGMKYLPGGCSFYFGYINTIVHFVMYSYYLITVLDERSQKYIWWKKHLTQLQLVQFTMLLIIFGSAAIKPGCSYPWQISLIICIQYLTMLAMFSDYYYKAYLKKRPPVS